MANYVNYRDFGKKSEPIQGNVIEIQSAEHKQQLVEQARQTGQLLLVDIWGSFCGPCKQVRPAYEALSLKYPTVVFCAEDVTMELTPEATVVPWFQFIGQGQVLEDKKGADIVGIEQTILKYLQGGANHPPPQTQPQAPPRNPKFTPGPPPGGYLPGGGYAQGNRGIQQGAPPPNQQPGTRYQQPGMYSQGPPVAEAYQGSPSMGSYPTQPTTQRPGGNPPTNRPPTYDMQRPTRTPHGIRPNAHRTIY